ARNWYSERIDDGPTKLEIVETFIEKENSENIYCIFNFNPPVGGFVMVSADDIVVPILGYSFEQNYGLKNHPPQFDAMLANFKEQIVYAKENRLSATREISDEWKRLKVKTEDFKKIRDIKDVSPLLDPIAWDQNWDWNEYCPVDAAGPGGHVYAGCTAVAMAQVMKYWAHPNTGTGSSFYYHPVYGWLSANYADTIYEWANMPDNLASSDTKTLLYHCGVSVEMDYGSSGSGAWVGEYSPSALTALKGYFKYDLSAYFILKDNYANSTWENMVRNELDNGRPLIYRGYNEYGHAFNMDGYQGTNYFHFNWGWSGAYNGYYYLTELNPGGYSFTNDQGGIFSLFPIATGSIEGIVTLNGGTGNLEEADITVGEVTVNSDSTGYYIINITPEIYNVTASLEGYKDSTIVDVEVFEEQVTDGIDFTLEVYNGPPDWEAIAGTAYHMVLMVEITLDEEEFEGIGNNMSGAFCWTDSLECRGVATWEAGATGFWYFDIVSNVNTGEEISFKIYDSETDMIYTCNETIVFENNTTIGTPFDPYQLTSTTKPVVVIAIDGDDVVITWGPVSGATDYKVYLSYDPYTEFTELATTGGATTYTHIDGATETKYFYRVTAILP
ncbi:MAG: C10 family peptidase, partial [Candidatus Cloacimonetes bacterium]|nr:C10 family peptidase [Candidatus Cloacimonadota bacterium]